MKEEVLAQCALMALAAFSQGQEVWQMQRRLAGCSCAWLKNKTCSLMSSPGGKGRSRGSLSTEWEGKSETISAGNTVYR